MKTGMASSPPTSPSIHTFIGLTITYPLLTTPAPYTLSFPRQFPTSHPLPTIPPFPCLFLSSSPSPLFLSQPQYSNLIRPRSLLPTSLLSSRLLLYISIPSPLLFALQLILSFLLISSTHSSFNSSSNLHTFLLLFTFTSTRPRLCLPTLATYPPFLPYSPSCCQGRGVQTSL